MNKGKKIVPWNKGKQKIGPIGYAGYHRRVYRLRGKAVKCEFCMTENSKRYEWANKTGKYDDVDDYIQLCSSCHFKFDGKVKNLKLEKMKSRICEKCKKEFKPTNGNQRFCGNPIQKTGCAYLHLKEYALSQYYKHKK